MAAEATSAEPGRRSAPARRRMFVMAVSPLPRTTSKRPGPRGWRIVRDLVGERDRPARKAGCGSEVVGSA